MIVVTAVLGTGTLDLSMTGHEDPTDNEGGRVCAAVSTTIHNALLGLEQIALHHPSHIRIDIKENQ